MLDALEVEFDELEAQYNAADIDATVCVTVRVVFSSQIQHATVPSKLPMQRT